MAAVGLVWLSVSCWLLLLAAGAGNTDVRVVETPVRRKNPGSRKEVVIVSALAEKCVN